MNNAQHFLVKQNSSTQRRIASQSVAAAVFSAIFLFSNAALAYCNTGNGLARTFALPLKMPWGVEEPRSNTTCDGDSIYLGRVKDLVRDGQAVEVRIAGDSSMSNEREFASSGSRSGRSFRLTGAFWMRICKSSVPLGQQDRRNCSPSVSHLGS